MPDAAPSNAIAPFAFRAPQSAGGGEKAAGGGDDATTAAGGAVTLAAGGELLPPWKMLPPPPPSPPPKTSGHFCAAAHAASVLHLLRTSLAEQHAASVGMGGESASDKMQQMGMSGWSPLAHSGTGVAAMPHPQTPSRPAPSGRHSRWVGARKPWAVMGRGAP